MFVTGLEEGLFPREQPERDGRARGRAAAHVRRAHARARRLYLRTRSRACCMARRYHIASRFIDEIPRISSVAVTGGSATARSTSTKRSGARSAAHREAPRRRRRGAWAERAPRQVRRRRHRRRGRPRQRRAFQSISANRGLKWLALGTRSSSPPDPCGSATAPGVSNASVSPAWNTSRAHIVGDVQRAAKRTCRA